MSKAAKRPREEVLEVAQSIASKLSPFCHRIELAGSLRRECPLVGDIELVAVPKLPVNLFGEVVASMPTELDFFLEAQRVKFSMNGAKYKKFAYGSYTVDLFLQPDAATWGMNFAIRTGSADFTHWLVTTRQAGGALPSDLRVQHARIWRGNEVLDTPEEEDVFKALELDWIAPPERDAGRWPTKPARTRLPTAQEQADAYARDNIDVSAFVVRAGRLTQR